MTWIYLLIGLDVAIFVGIYFGFIQKYEQKGQIVMSVGTILGLGLVSYFVFSFQLSSQQSSCNCSEQDIGQRLNQAGTDAKNGQNVSLEYILCCFPQENFSILVREDYMAIDENDTTLISSKPIKTSIGSYVSYLSTMYSADTICILNFKKTSENQMMYLELQEINK